MPGPRSGNQATTAVRTIRRLPTQMARHQRAFLHKSLEEETYGIADEDFSLEQNLVADLDGGVTASPRAREQTTVAHRFDPARASLRWPNSSQFSHWQF
ncbi:hypothetical protein ACFORO_21640 [Amycolatopsis halotolerans]|uniref:Uncharacterized protein n=1 Tax=Amycolatopsis halotolerans TaxID=330083 RepID=A0ABV7QHH6_9PSEU